MRPDQVKLIAKRLGVTEQDVIDMNCRLGGDASLNAPIREDGDSGEWTEFRNNYVNWDKMQGHIKVYPDIDEGLPQSPDQIRDTIMRLAEMASKGNPIAEAIFDITTNQEEAMAMIGPQGWVLNKEPILRN